MHLHLTHSAQACSHFGSCSGSNKDIVFLFEISHTSWIKNCLILLTESNSPSMDCLWYHISPFFLSIYLKRYFCEKHMWLGHFNLVSLCSSFYFFPPFLESHIFFSIILCTFSLSSASVDQCWVLSLSRIDECSPCIQQSKPQTEYSGTFVHSLVTTCWDKAVNEKQENHHSNKNPCFMMEEDHPV